MNYIWVVHFAIGIILICFYYYLTGEVDRRHFPCPDNVTQHSGYITVNDRTVNHYFYWFFESRHNPTRDPLILWVDGGPGCSGLVSMLLQNGPCIMREGGKAPVLNKDSWNNFANILYIDQPVGTGFSYSETPQEVKLDDRTIALELAAFLESFYLKYPKYYKLRLYIIGYSYAGHYIPLFSTHVINNNPNIRKSLKGIGIGNGWVDPKSHFSSYSDYMHLTGFIKDEDLPEIHTARDTCLNYITSTSPSAYSKCVDSYLQPLIDIAQQHAERSVSMYDVRLPCNTSNALCYDLSGAVGFLNNDDVQRWLGVNNISWTECSVSVYDAMEPGMQIQFVEDIAFALEKGVKVVLYNGRHDLVCNYLGGRKWVESMVWSRQDKFNSMHFVDWYFQGKIVGTYKTFANLTLVEMIDAGHMAGMDQPVLTLQIIRDLIYNLPFGEFNY